MVSSVNGRSIATLSLRTHITYEKKVLQMAVVKINTVNVNIAVYI